MERYPRPTVALHWLTALLIIAAFGLGITMVDIPGLTPTKLKYFSWHKWLGVTVFGLACLRLLWRLTHRAPAYPHTMPGWQQQAAHALHGLLYLLIFAIPLSGYFYSLSAGVPVVYLGMIPLPAFIHPDPELKIILKHQFIDKDGVLKRMLP